MDTNLWFIALTAKQVTQLSTLRTSVVLGFTYNYDTTMLVANTSRALSGGEILNLKNAVIALPDTYSQEYYIAVFNVVKFQTDLADLLPSFSSIDLRWEFAALNAYATNKDFEGLRGYLETLKAAGVATQNDVDLVVGAVANQGVIC